MLKYRRIKLNNSPRYAIVDADDYERVSKYKWNAKQNNVRHTVYAYATNAWKDGDNGIFMHRYILNAREGITVDHRDGNGLNNRRSNFRYATNQQNVAHRVRMNCNNTSGHRGVSRCKLTGLWFVHIKCKRVPYRLGTYEKVESALAVRRAAEVLLFGDFAPPCSHKCTELVGKFATIAALIEGTKSIKAASGAFGVTKSGNNWRARLRREELGVYRTIAEASAAVEKRRLAC